MVLNADWLSSLAWPLNADCFEHRCFVNEQLWCFCKREKIIWLLTTTGACVCVCSYRHGGGTVWSIEVYHQWRHHHSNAWENDGGEEGGARYNQWVGDSSGTPVDSPSAYFVDDEVLLLEMVPKKTMEDKEEEEQEDDMKEMTRQDTKVQCLTCLSHLSCPPKLLTLFMCLRCLPCVTSCQPDCVFISPDRLSWLTRWWTETWQQRRCRNQAISPPITKFNRFQKYFLYILLCYVVSMSYFCCWDNLYFYLSVFTCQSDQDEDLKTQVHLCAAVCVVYVRLSLFLTLLPGCLGHHWKPRGGTTTSELHQCAQTLFLRGRGEAGGSTDRVGEASCIVTSTTSWLPYDWTTGSRGGEFTPLSRKRWTHYRY